MIMEKKPSVVEFSIKGIENSKVSIDIEAIRKARNNDNRGYATFSLVNPLGKDFCINSNGNPIPVTLLLLDTSKKSKGKDKSEKEAY